MPVDGMMFIDGQEIRGEGQPFHALTHSVGMAIDPPFGSATEAQLDAACAAAAAVSDDFAHSPPGLRARLLELIAERILDIGDELIARAMSETGLPHGRLAGERIRTVNQLRGFAALLRAGDFAEVRIDPADPARTPVPKPDLRMYKVALGPVAVFSASNFPLAFSVAGGDTAAALAAGCPVIVKAHAAHPGTSELVARAVRDAVAESGLPGGIFACLFDSGFAVGQSLVADHRIRAVGFTGSRSGGTALMDIAARRPEPIPVYAEMSSVNPVILMPARLEAQADKIAEAFVGALTLGAGQFCTNPGLVIAMESPGLARFVSAASDLLCGAESAPMLTTGILRAYEGAIAGMEMHDGVRLLAAGKDADGSGAPRLFTTDAETFLREPDLHREIFGAAALLVRCATPDERIALLDRMEGQLTIAIHMDEADHEDVARLLPLIERKAGRLIANGFGTGVEVSPAMVHGGPYPSTSDGRSTSVGTLAIERFQRPVCYQDMPDALLPAPLRRGNPWALRQASP